MCISRTYGTELPFYIHLPISRPYGTRLFDVNM